MERALLYIPSSEIVDYITRNPIDWGDSTSVTLSNRRVVRLGELAKRGGIGDTAGVTPTPAVEEFINLLVSKRGLFTQDEYMRHCVSAWNVWATSKTPDQKFGIKAKLYRNFYPSMVDSLHVWAMLCESGMFEMCFLSATEDAIGKSDLVLRSGSKEIRLALLGPTAQAGSDREYKIAHRNNGDTKCVELKMPPSYPKSPGNKRWFRKSDVMQAILSQGITQPAELSLLAATP